MSKANAPLALPSHTLSAGTGSLFQAPPALTGHAVHGAGSLFQAPVSTGNANGALLPPPLPQGASAAKVITNKRARDQDKPEEVRPKLSDRSKMATTESLSTIKEDTPNDLPAVDVYSSPAPSAHTIGINAAALNSDESRLVVSREDGSLAVCSVQPNRTRFMAAMTPLVRTGSFDGHTVTRLFYALADSVIVASYLSGQVVVYDSTTLTVLYVAERFGGAIWDMVPLVERKYKTYEQTYDFELNKDANGMEIPVEPTPAAENVNSEEIELVCACADGSWHHFNLVRTSRQKNTFSLDLIQILPKVVGAHRALSVTYSDNIICGSDDSGNIVGWKYHGKGIRGYTQLWITRLPKGAYAKTMCIDTETNSLAVGTSIGDVVIFSLKKGNISNIFGNHSGPISSIIWAGKRTLLATGWHDSLRAYRFSGKWIPSEVRRRTHYHEASQLLYLSTAQAVLSASRDGTILIAGLFDDFKIPPKYCQPVSQLYAFAADASVLMTVAGNRVEFYRSNESMSRWTPLACYTAHGPHGISGIWCDPSLSRIAIATTTRLVILTCTQKSLTAVNLRKIADFEYPNVHGLLFRGAKDCYAVYGLGKLAHISFGASGSSSRPSVITSTLDLPISATNVDALPCGSLLVGTSSVQNERARVIYLNPDGSIRPSRNFSTFLPIIATSGNGLGLGLSSHFVFYLLDKETRTHLPRNLPVDTVFFSRFQRGTQTMFMGYCLRGLIFATNDAWWLADSEYRRENRSAHDVEQLDRSTMAATSGLRTTYIGGFNADNVNNSRAVVLQRDIEAEVETLPLMWKVRRFGN